MLTAALSVSLLAAIAAGVGFYRRGGQLAAANAKLGEATTALGLANDATVSAAKERDALAATLVAERRAREDDARKHTDTEGRLSAELARARKDLDAVASLSPAAAGARLDSVLSAGLPAAPVRPGGTLAGSGAVPLPGPGRDGR